MRIRTFTIVCVLTAMSSVQHAPAEDSGWNQFGGAFNWETDGDLPTDRLGIVWTQNVGQGRGQVVGGRDAIYVVSGAVTDTTPPENVTIITRRNAATGNVVWQHDFSTPIPEDQQTFSGDQPSPQATPAVLNNRLYVISFTGALQCLSCEDGRLLWEKHLVDDLHADPVQFGFASSPVIVPGNDRQIFVLAAGKQGGFYALDAATGQTDWKTDCSSFSYATPVFATLHGQPQWILVSQEEIRAVSASSSNLRGGAELWRYAWPETGLTNVPTPLVMNASTVVISGQGCGGTRGLSITRNDDEWQVKEAWTLKSPQYFYTNWMKLSDRLMLGADARTLTAIETTDGERAGRWRGYADANLIRVGEQLLCVDGRGQMTRLQIRRNADGSCLGLQPVDKASVIAGRCWTAASYINGRLFVRAEDRLICLAADSDNLPPLLAADGTMLSLAAGTATASNPVEQIFTVFEEQGATAALAVYAKLRSDGKLDPGARYELTVAAQQQGLAAIARKIARDAAADYPDKASAPWIRDALKQN
ncbi:MAG: PQQ-like beta-propeller repeat protein [Planctomycetaceae bacterium]|nr:PQQ-like beta-propeller repeat protein [Planctomycetaceae bacterium]